MLDPEIDSIKYELGTTRFKDFLKLLPPVTGERQCYRNLMDNLDSKKDAIMGTIVF